MNNTSSLRASASAPVCGECSANTVQLDAASTACLLAAVYTSHHLHLLSLAIVQRHHAAAHRHDMRQSAGNAGDSPCKQLAEQNVLGRLSDLGGLASAGPIAVGRAAGSPPRQASNQLPTSAAPAGKQANTSPLHLVLQSATLPGPTSRQDSRLHESLGVLMATDRKIVDTLKNTEVILLTAIFPKVGLIKLNHMPCRNGLLLSTTLAERMLKDPPR